MTKRFGVLLENTLKTGREGGGCQKKLLCGKKDGKWAPVPGQNSLTTQDCRGDYSTIQSSENGKKKDSNDKKEQKEESAGRRQNYRTLKPRNYEEGLPKLGMGTGSVLRRKERTPFN